MATTVSSKHLTRHFKHKYTQKKQMQRQSWSITCYKRKTNYNKSSYWVDKIIHSFTFLNKETQRTESSSLVIQWFKCMTLYDTIQSTVFPLQLILIQTVKMPICLEQQFLFAKKDHKTMKIIPDNILLSGSQNTTKLLDGSWLRIRTDKEGTNLSRI